MATVRRFVDDDDMYLEEAPEAAVDKRNFLLNRVFKSVQLPDESSYEESDDILSCNVTIV